MTLCSLASVVQGGDATSASCSSERGKEFLGQWFVYPFHKAVVHPSFLQSAAAFTWHRNDEEFDDVFCVWWSPSLFESLASADDLDDREFQIPRHVKKGLTQEVHDIIESSDHNANSDILSLALVQLKRALPHQSHLCAEETLGLKSGRIMRRRRKNSKKVAIRRGRRQDSKKKAIARWRRKDSKRPRAQVGTKRPRAQVGMLNYNLK